jgi:hypothetical protein
MFGAEQVAVVVLILVVVAMEVVVLVLFAHLKWLLAIG